MLQKSSLDRYVQSSTLLESEVLRIAQRKKMFTADDLHTDYVLLLIERLHRNKRVLGAVLASLKVKGLIQETRYVKSVRKECHHRPIMMWKVT